MWELRDCGMRDSVGVYKLSHRLFRGLHIFLHREHLFFGGTSHFYFIGNTCFLGDFLFLVF